MSFLFRNLKNTIGWKTKRKLIVFAVDDYGNVRLDSTEARNKLDAAGIKIHSRFDAFDTLETTEDLEILFETLCSVKDVNGRHAVFTPYALPCNINFEKIGESDYERYEYELLPETYKKIPGYESTMTLWRQGIAEGIFVPQFHGREHVNLKVFKEKLEKRDPELLSVLDTRSFTSISDSGYPTIAWPAAFDFWNFTENRDFAAIIKTGLTHFEEVFGYKATCFTPPVYNCHPVNYPVLGENGIQTIDTGLLQYEHQGNGEFKKRLNYTGKPAGNKMKYVVRNVVFEPGEDRGIDWVGFTMKQIAAAFRWSRPAIISSHRVNFCGHISLENRTKGIKLLKELLFAIVNKWPEVEFISAADLAMLLHKKERDV